MEKIILNVPTKLGTLTAYESLDPAHPGIYIDLHRDGHPADMPVALIEEAEDEADQEGICLVTRVWGNSQKEDYTHRTIHAGVEPFFQDTEWTLTDDDSFQIRRQLKDGVFELYQINVLELYPKKSENCFRISHAVIYISDINIPDILRCYGYDSIEGLKEEYGWEWQGILAECEFELMSQDGECFIDRQNLSWNEAKKRIIRRSGYQNKEKSHGKILHCQKRACIVS